MISEHTTVKSKLSTSVLCQISSSQPTYIFQTEMSYDHLYWSRFHAQVTNTLVFYAFIWSWSSKVKDRTTHTQHYHHLCVLYSLEYHISTHFSKTICSDKMKESFLIFCQSHLNYKIPEGCFSVPQSLHTSLLLHIRSSIHDR